MTRRDHLFSLVVGLQNSVSVQRHMDFNLLECARAENTGNFVFVDWLSGLCEFICMLGSNV
jgi:hypothetical protein